MGIVIQPPAPPIGTVGGLAGAVPTSASPATPASATAAANSQVQITVNAVAGQAVRLLALSGSYSAAPTGGTLTVVVNAVTVVQLDIAAAGPFSVPLPPGGLECQVGQAAVITLTAAGAAVVGRLNAATIYGT